MKCMIVYSSKTGNTRMIAEAIHKVLPKNSVIYPVQQAPEPDSYDFIAVGGWVDKGMPDEATANYMKKVKGKDVGTFMTLGAYPDSDHAKESMRNASELLNGNNILGTFICQGKVDPQLIKWMQNITEKQPGNPHAMDNARKKRLAEAAKHPNEQDCENAAAAFRAILEKIEGVTNA